MGLHKNCNKMKFQAYFHMWRLDKIMVDKCLTKE